MANSEYIKSGNVGAFAGVVAWPDGMNYLGNLVEYLTSNLVTPIVVGMAAMVDYEIMGIIAVDDAAGTITVKRGCADTIPALHDVGAPMWIFDASSMGTDGVERAAGEVIGVKVSPYTAGGGTLDPVQIMPDTVEFAWRWMRPYLPGQLRVNTTRWYSNSAGMTDASPYAVFTWVHRDRVLQADQLVGHDDATIGPEPGTTYVLYFYHLNGTLLRTEAGIADQDFTYLRQLALFDMGYPSEYVTMTFRLTAERNGAESYTAYSGYFGVYPSIDTTVSYQAFAQQFIEAPYIMNLHGGVTNPGGAHVIAMAARPSDRTIDSYATWSNQIVTAHYTKLTVNQAFTPWVTSTYRLPELEQILTIGTSSLFDGVRVYGAVTVGQLALIDSELVKVVEMHPDYLVIMRGCGDTIPAVHVAGSRLWFIEAAASRDPIERAVDLTIDYRLVPNWHMGDPDNEAHPDAAPQHILALTNRAARPYPPGRIVVGGRPWFEEAQALVDAPMIFSWARRRRDGQGAIVVGHTDPDQGIDAGQVTRLRFFYYMSGPGGLYTVTMSEIDFTTETSYAYPYADAVAHGLTAGTATGQCGTVVIYCRLFSVRDGLDSDASYIIPIRVPSYAC